MDSLLEDWNLTVLFFFSLRFACSSNTPIRSISVTFFFHGPLFFKYVESNQSNTLDREKPSQQNQTIFLHCSSLFLRASVFSLLKKGL